MSHSMVSLFLAHPPVTPPLPSSITQPPSLPPQSLVFYTLVFLNIPQGLPLASECICARRQPPSTLLSLSVPPSWGGGSLTASLCQSCPFFQNTYLPRSLSPHLATLSFF